MPLTNPLKQKLARGETCLGTMVTMPSAPLVQLLAGCGFDWVLIDMEHGPIGPESMQSMITATAPSGSVPLVRVPATDPWMTKIPLDAGALGLFFPMVTSVERTRDAVSASTYPPIGTRGFGPFNATSRWNINRSNYVAEADAVLLRVIMIEHVEAIDVIDDMVSVEGFDVAFIAPFDLSQSLGCAGDFDHPDFRRAVAKAEKAITASNVVMGGLAPTTEAGKAMEERGYRFLMMGYDGLIIETAARQLVEQMRD